MPPAVSTDTSESYSSESEYQESNGSDEDQCSDKEYDDEEADEDSEYEDDEVEADNDDLADNYSPIVGEYTAAIETVLSFDDIEVDEREADEVASQIDRQLSSLRSKPAYSCDSDDEELFNGNIHPPEYYRQEIQQVDEGSFMRKEYSKGTEDQIARVEAVWRWYCEDVLFEDWRRKLQTLVFAEVYQFINWHLNQRKNRSGKTKRRVLKHTSLVTFWCMFRLVFERQMTVKIDSFIDRQQICNGLVRLGKLHNLTHETRENRAMTLNDLKLQIYTTISTEKKAFKMGEQRILAVLFLLLLAPAGSRPSSILQLRFKDIRVLLARDPNGGPHRLLIKFTLNFTKQYLGPKAAKTFLIPEIIFDPSLLLSPHVFLLGILFRHKAFRAEGLNENPRAISALDIHDGDNELRLPLKPSLDDKFVFRQSERTARGTELSDNAVTLGMVSAWVRTIGRLAGFEYTTICYSLRYMAGNNMDRNVSEALRNLVMDHAPGSDTFQKHYLNRNICADLWALHRQHQPQEALIQQAASHGHSVSSRRAKELELFMQQRSRELEHSPDMVRMRGKVSRMPLRSAERKTGRLKVRARKARLYAAEQHKHMQSWTNEQAVKDIEWQIQGNRLDYASGRQDEDQHKDGGSIMQHRNPYQRRLVEALTAPLVTTVDELYERRAKAIDVIVQYCAIEEPLRTKITEANQPAVPAEIQLTTRNRTRDEVNNKLRRSVIVTTVGERLRRCFLCVGRALRISPDDPNFNKYCRTYGTDGEIVRHFNRAHLQHLRNEQIECPVCIPAIWMKHKQHVQRHAELVHGIKSQSRFGY